MAAIVLSGCQGRHRGEHCLGYSTAVVPVVRFEGSHVLVSAEPTPSCVLWGPVAVPTDVGVR